MSYLTIVFLTLALGMLSTVAALGVIQMIFPYRACYPNTLYGKASMIVRQVLCLD